jgi:MFS transporter, ACS family, pantothenate transporter
MAGYDKETKLSSEIQIGKPINATTDAVPASNDSASDSATANRVQGTPKRSWRSYLWDTFDKSPEERRFLFKLDAVLLTFASLGYFIKYVIITKQHYTFKKLIMLQSRYLDQININNAVTTYIPFLHADLCPLTLPQFVSGMKEDLGLYKNQLNYMQTLWTVGYVLGEIPRSISATIVTAHQVNRILVTCSLLAFVLLFGYRLARLPGPHLPFCLQSAKMPNLYMPSDSL